MTNISRGKKGVSYKKRNANYGICPPAKITVARLLPVRLNLIVLPGKAAKRN
jgi:hypothetical protein